MWRKTAIKRVLNLIPSNPDDALSKAIALDNEIDMPAPEIKKAPATVVSVRTQPVSLVPNENFAEAEFTSVPATASGSNALDSIVADTSVETLTSEERNLNVFQETEAQVAKPKRR
jgi:hypothetical protein